MSRWHDEVEDEYLFDLDDRVQEGYQSRSYFDVTEPPDLPTARHSGFWQMPLCVHPPQPVLVSKDAGWEVYAGAGPDCMGRSGEFDLLLNLTGDTVFGGHIIPFPELKQWERPGCVPEIVLDWPDMGIIHLPREFWAALIALLAQRQAKMLVFCVGGHGRTGTAVASLMAASGWSSADAIAWIRAHYCSRAIETEAQEEYVRWIANETFSPAASRNLTRSR